MLYWESIEKKKNCFNRFAPKWVSKILEEPLSFRRETFLRVPWGKRELNSSGNKDTYQQLEKEVSERFLFFSLSSPRTKCEKGKRTLKSSQASTWTLSKFINFLKLLFLSMGFWSCRLIVLILLFSRALDANCRRVD